jgi:hypothetical protein
MPRASSELNMLKHSENRGMFHRDLGQINNDLHRRGILPGMDLVDGPQGTALVQDRPPPMRYGPGYRGTPGRGGYGPQGPGGYGPQGMESYGPQGSEGGMPPEMPYGQQMPEGYRGGPQNYTTRRVDAQRWRNPQYHGWGHNPGHTYDGAGRADPETLQRSAQLVGQIAQQMGVDPVTAVAAMLVESGGNPHAVGDRGTSFGLFQLHRGGELGRMSPQQAFDPVTNTEVALSEFRKHGRGDPGMVAAASQRPKNRAAYARLVDEAVPEARRLLGMG